MPALVELEEMEKKETSKPKDDKISLGKRLMLEELEREFTSSESAFFSRFDRLNVQDLSELRRNLDKVSKRTILVKHTFAKKILAKMKLSDAERFLEGATLVTLGAKEPQLVSKTLVEFMKGRENIELRGMILDGKTFDGIFIKELARLPSRKELLTAVAIGMKSPITAFVMTLNGILQSFVVVLNEIQKKKAQEA